MVPLQEKHGHIVRSVVHDLEEEPRRLAENRRRQARIVIGVVQRCRHGRVVAALRCLQQERARAQVASWWRTKGPAIDACRVDPGPCESTASRGVSSELPAENGERGGGKTPGKSIISVLCFHFRNETGRARENGELS